MQLASARGPGPKLTPEFRAFAGEGRARGADRAARAARRALAKVTASVRVGSVALLGVEVCGDETLGLDDVYEAVSIVYGALGDERTVLVTTSGTDEIAGTVRVRVFF